MPRKPTTKQLADFKKWMRKNAPATPVRQDVSDIIAACRIMFKVEFAAAQHNLLADLLDQWSSRSLLVAISILSDNAMLDGLDFFELFQAQISRALYFLSLLPVEEWRAPDVLERWKRFSFQIPIEEELARFWPENPLHKLAREQYEKLSTENTQFIN